MVFVFQKTWKKGKWATGYRRASSKRYYLFLEFLYFICGAEKKVIISAFFSHFIFQ